MANIPETQPVDFSKMKWLKRLSFSAHANIKMFLQIKVRIKKNQEACQVKQLNHRTPEVRSLPAEAENTQALSWLIYCLAAGRAMLLPLAPAGGKKGSLQEEQTLKS